MGRNARGVRGISLRGDDAVVDMIVTNESASVLTVCENGYGKRTQVGEYRKTKRGGKGVINIKTTQRNGRVVALKSVSDTDELRSSPPRASPADRSQPAARNRPRHPACGSSARGRTTGVAVDESPRGDVEAAVREAAVGYEPRCSTDRITHQSAPTI